MDSRIVQHTYAVQQYIGWCFNVQSWKYDPDGQEPIDNKAAYPRCPTVTQGDVIPPVDADTPQNDALYFGCIAYPEEGAVPPPPVSQTQTRPKRMKPKPSMHLDRLGSFRK